MDPEPADQVFLRAVRFRCSEPDPPEEDVIDAVRRNGRGWDVHITAHHLPDIDLTTSASGTDARGP